jgi:pumilio homology domain family member 6
VSLFKDQVHQLVHTKDGAYAACLIISYSTAKDRKAVVKCVKEIIPQMATDQFGHIVLIVMCAVVDDTKLISKAILTELKSAWQDLIRDKWGRKLVLFLCREDNDPFLKECREKSVNTRHESIDLSRLIFSKKDTQIRRQELLEFISDDLLGIISSGASALMRDPLAIQVAQEILLNSRGFNIS